LLLLLLLLLLPLVLPRLPFWVEVSRSSASSLLALSEVGASVVNRVPPGR